MSFPKGLSINDGIPSEFASVKYGSVGQAIKIIKKLGKNTFMSKTDIEHAFRLIPLHESQWELIVFKFENEWYIDTCLPMGARSSCAIFEKFLSEYFDILKSITNNVSIDIIRAEINFQFDLNNIYLLIIVSLKSNNYS